MKRRVENVKKITLTLIRWDNQLKWQVVLLTIFDSGAILHQRLRQMEIRGVLEALKGQDSSQKLRLSKRKNVVLCLNSCHVCCSIYKLRDLVGVSASIPNLLFELKVLLWREIRSLLFGLGKQSGGLRLRLCLAVVDVFNVLA